MKIVKIGGTKLGIIIPREILEKVLKWNLETLLDYEVQFNTETQKIEFLIKELEITTKERESQK